MTVKIFIKRQVRNGNLEEALGLVHTLRVKAMNHVGYISGETMINHYDPQTIMVVSNWQAVDDWIDWQESNERDAIETRLDNLLEEASTYEVYDLGAP